MLTFSFIPSELLLKTLQSLFCHGSLNTYASLSILFNFSFFRLKCLPSPSFLIYFQARFYLLGYYDPVKFVLARN